MNDQCNHHFITGSRDVQYRPKFTGMTWEHFHFVYNSPDSFPIAVRADKNNTIDRRFNGTEVNVFGEVYDVCDNVLARIRRLEGFPDWYKECKVNVLTDCGKTVEAIMYYQDKHQLLNRDVLHLGMLGDFREKDNIVTHYGFSNKI
jgi:gamma-glutamylcyclotransferase (GGCT)/AIG2-like uncharacterized protein YtfP